MSAVIGQESLLHQALNLLMDESASSIAIVGPGGIGKTTLMKQLYSKLLSSNRFDTVIWITVSSNLVFQKIQDDISRSLGLFVSDWVGKSSDEKSQLIRTEISSRKPVLFLDDLWFHIDLESLGVEGSKFIYSTRNTGLPKTMGAHTVFNLVELSDEDAWELFRSKVEDDQILQNVIIRDKAQKLVRNCKGLPILISTLGAAMSYRKAPKEWESALHMIERDRQQYIQTAIFEPVQLRGLDEVTSIFQFCFDSLSSSMISCLLYFSSFPEDFTILKEELIDFWICENIIGAHSVRGYALSLGYEVMHTLIKAGFVEEEGNDCVKLLDMIRDFAKARITKVRNFGVLLASMLRFLRRSVLFIEQCCYEERTLMSTTIETMGWISSMGDSIRYFLADVPANLFTFLLDHNPFIMIKPRPSSSLYNLTVLDLSNSGVVVVHRDVSTLVSLQYLNLSHTWIDRLPVELKALTKLKCLNLEYDDQLRTISKELISSLLSLQILKTFRCGYSVEEEASNMLSVRNMDINPLLSLEHLEVLSITITCGSALHTFFNNAKLLDCTESLSLEVFWGSETLNITPLAFMENLLTFEIHQAELLKELNVHHSELLRTVGFERLQEVTFEKCSSLEEVAWVILVPNLTILTVKSCEKIQEIISSERLRKTEAGENLKLFEKLEILSLDSLPELGSINPTALPFQCLKKMEITDCFSLKKLPLNSTVTKANELVIEAEEEWWKEVEWEDEASKATFFPCFKPLM